MKLVVFYNNDESSTSGETSQAVDNVAEEPPAAIYDKKEITNEYSTSGETSQAVDTAVAEVPAATIRDEKKIKREADRKKKMKDADGPPMYPDNPTVCRPKNDIVLERGRFCKNHPGNKTLRRIVELLKPWYQNLEPAENKIVVKYLMAWFESTGRKFVVRLKTDAPWMEASSTAVRESLTHMLRDNNKRTGGDGKS